VSKRAIRVSHGTQIEWTDKTWSPTVGCTRVSDGCEHCYAEGVAHRGRIAAHKGLTVAGPKGPRWTGEVRLLPDRLNDPLRWRKPRRVFVDSMSDLFHESVPWDFIARVFATMILTPQHTYQILTKRTERMRDGMEREIPRAIHAACLLPSTSYCGDTWPPKNVHLGASCENQPTLEARVSDLLATPAALRFLSLEPLLGAINLTRVKGQRLGGKLHGFALYDCLMQPTIGAVVPRRAIDWVIVGCDSGPGARPCDVEWIRSIVAQCRSANVPAFVKQLGARPIVYREEAERLAAAGARIEWDDSGERISARWVLRDRNGGDPAEWPADLRVREFPATKGGDDDAS